MWNETMERKKKKSWALKWTAVIWWRIISAMIMNHIEFEALSMAKWRCSNNRNSHRIYAHNITHIQNKNCWRIQYVVGTYAVKPIRTKSQVKPNCDIQLWFRLLNHFLPLRWRRWRKKNEKQISFMTFSTAYH